MYLLYSEISGLPTWDTLGETSLFWTRLGQPQRSWLARGVSPDERQFCVHLGIRDCPHWECPLTQDASTGYRTEQHSTADKLQPIIIATSVVLMCVLRFKERALWASLAVPPGGVVQTERSQMWILQEGNYKNMLKVLIDIWLHVSV